MILQLPLLKNDATKLNDIIGWSFDPMADFEE